MADIKPIQMDLGKRYLLRYQTMKAARHNWESHWSEVAKYVLPRKDDVYGYRSVGDERHDFVYDGTPMHANETLAASLAGMMVSSTERWLEYNTGIDELDLNPQIAKYLQEIADRQMSVYAYSNFYSEVHETLIDVGAIGTSVFFTEEDPKFTIRCLSSPIYDFYIETDIFKNVVAICEEKKYQVFQLVSEFKIKNLPPDIQKFMDTEEGMRKSFTVLHFVEKDGTFDVKKPKAKKPWKSVHLLLDHKHILKVSGYWEMPYSVPRWTVSQREIYGRSPAMKALPDIRMLNEVMRSYLRTCQKVGDPLLQIPSEGFTLPIDSGPGGINFYNSVAAGKDRIEALNTGARPEVSNELLEGIRHRINQAFFIDKLQLRDGPQMTATETIQRTEEQMRVMGPVTTRIDHDFLIPQVERTFGIMARRGMFPEPPPELAGRNINIKLVSRIAKAQRSSQADSLMRTLNSLGPMIEYNPEKTLAAIKPEKALRIYGALYGLPQEIIKTDEELEEEQTRRQQIEEQMARSEIDKNEASAEKDLATAESQGQEV